NEGTGFKLGVPDVAEEESYESEAESWGNNKDDSNNEHVSSGEDSDQEKAKSDHEENKEDEDDKEAKIIDKAKGKEDEEMYYTTSQLYDNVDIRLNEPVDTDKGFVQEEGTDAAMTNTKVPVTSSSHSSDLAGTDAAMTNVQQGNENPEILQSIKDAHVRLSTVPQKTEVLVTSSSHSFDLAAKFLKFQIFPI
nr:hypothetical protein [Tanacetum cinerariifolium]